MGLFGGVCGWIACVGRVVVSMNGIVYEERVGMLLLCSTGLTDA